MSEIESRLHALGLTLPESASPPAASYVPYVVSDGIVTISGQLPMIDGNIEGNTGILGKDVTLEEGVRIAKLCTLNVLAHLKAACQGDFSRVHQVIRLGVFVASTPEFVDQPLVANGASELILTLFEERGAHARAAVGVSSLPKGVAVEVEAQCRIRP